MNPAEMFAVILATVLLGILITWLLVRSHWKVKNLTLQSKLDLSEQKLLEQGQLFANSEKTLRDAFGSLAADALQKNNIAFVNLAETKLGQKVAEAQGIFNTKEKEIDGIVSPLKESLTKMDQKITDLESKRAGAYESLKSVLDGMQKSTLSLDKGTQTLVNALKTSYTRGKYGEIGLRRVVEFAGMTMHCDFDEQVHVPGQQATIVPDMIIRLPEDKTIVVDSKIPLDAYLSVFNTEIEGEQKQFLAQHAAAVRQHLIKLSGKQYWDQFPNSPDYVIMYMQIESSFGAALQTDPSLIQFGIENKVILATPTTLITLLRTIAFVWQQRKIADNIDEIRKTAVELYNRTHTMIGHFSNVGGGLTAVVNNYNKAVGSLETRFLPQARKIHEMGPSYTKESMPELHPIEITVRDIVVPDNLPTEEQNNLH
jgi:DNA recombination protein RmuC